MTDLSATREFIQSLPKTETHLHVEGALPWELLEKKDPAKYSDQPAFRGEGFRYDSFEQFESILIDHALDWFDSPDSYHEAAKLIFSKQVEQNVKYVETSFHAGMMEFLKIPGEEILKAILSAVPSQLEARVFLGISRNAYTPYLGPLLEEAIEKWDSLAGIDLHGLESLPMEAWTQPFWKRASACGKTLKAHAGEFGPAANVEQAVVELGVRRIQHGVRSSESEKTMKLLLDEGVTLDLCPISNYKLRVVDEFEDHPIGGFVKRGIRCTVSTDDPLSFNNSLNQEYEVLVDKMGFSTREIGRLAWNGFEVADLDADRAASFQSQIDELVDEACPADE
ncbi:MAG: adenosine deaminase [Opitutae bacterium]|nr:adenosine deaminase [Opitutae bacterium]